MYEYNLELKKSLVNTRQLFAIIWRWRWKSWQGGSKRVSGGCGGGVGDGRVGGGGSNYNCRWL